MLTFYLAALVIGGVFVLLSAFGGGGHESGADGGALDHDGSVDPDLDHNAGADAGADTGTDASAGGHGGAEAAGHGEAGWHSTVWLPFLSVRFWTYFLAFFGLTGSLLTWVWQGGLATGLLSGAMGAACGLGMAYSSRYFGRPSKQSGLGQDDLVGAVAEVVVALRPGQVGQIRCSVKGQSFELPARADDDEPGDIPRGARVMIIDFEEGTARVVGVPENEQASAPEVAERTHKGA